MTLLNMNKHISVVTCRTKASVQFATVNIFTKYPKQITSNYRTVYLDKNNDLIYCKLCRWTEKFSIDITEFMKVISDFLHSVIVYPILITSICIINTIF
jgi:hypothetical protein